MSELAVGAELDAAVATKVFDWTMDRYGIWHTPRKPNGVASHGVKVPPYSTDIAAAWTVVDHLQKQGYQWRVETPKPDAHDWYEVRVWANRALWYAHGTTAPEAICRAALRALAP